MFLTISESYLVIVWRWYRSIVIWRNSLEDVQLFFRKFVYEVRRNRKRHISQILKLVNYPVHGMWTRKHRFSTMKYDDKLIVWFYWLWFAPDELYRLLQYVMAHVTLFSRRVVAMLTSQVAPVCELQVYDISHVFCSYNIELYLCFHNSQHSRSNVRNNIDCIVCKFHTL